MKTVLKLEELLKFLLSYILTLYLGFQWWVFLAWLLVPDISMLGYLLNKKVGAITYNIFHHQGLALLVGLTGFYTESTEILFSGIILFAHSSMDRVFGYGLKYSGSFKNTHLGKIGK